MELMLSAVGQKMPAWVTQGFEEYQRRMPAHLPLVLKEIPLAKRGKNAGISRLQQAEGEALMASIPPGAKTVALDQRGALWSTMDLARHLESWQLDGASVVFMVGGPDGLSKQCLQQAQQKWSLGSLTLPHSVVRIVLAEQLYRAWSITINHPYHRE